METDAEDICRLALGVGLWGEAKTLSLLQKYREQVPADGKETGKQFLEFLVQERHLTRYQAGCLQQGGRGLRHAVHFLISAPRGETQVWGRRWDAVHQQSSHPVVLFVFKPEFRRVARSLLVDPMATDPGCARIYGVWSGGQGETWVEEHPPGVPLARLLRTSGRIPVDRACSIALDIANTLVPLHTRGCSHGGVVPEEILIQKTGRTVLLSGLWRKACTASADCGAAGKENRSVDAAAPSLAGDVAEDVRALGSLLHTMLAGRPPSPHPSGPQAGKLEATSSGVSLEEIADAPEKLKALVERMLASRRKRPDMEAVARELLGFMPPGWCPQPRMINTSEDAFLASASGSLSFGWDGSTRESGGNSTASVLPDEAARVRTVTSVRPPETPPVPGLAPAASASPDDSAESVRVSVGPRSTVHERGAVRSKAFSLPASSLLVPLLLTAAVGLVAYRFGPSRTNARVAAKSPVARSQPLAEAGPPRTDAAGAPPTKSLLEKDPESPPARDAGLDTRRDTSLLWESPTQGEPIAFLRIPNGAQGMLWLRPASIQAEPNARSTLEALGPEVKERLAALLASLQLSVEETAELLIAFTPRDAETPEISLNLRVTDAARERAKSFVKNAQVNERGLQGTSGSWSVWFPKEASSWLIAASDATLTQLVEEDHRPILRRQLEVLRRVSDDQWLLYGFFTPNFLAADGDALWTGGLRKLRDPFLKFCGDSAQAVSVGCFVGPKVFFLEARLVYSGSESVATKVLEVPGRLDGVLEDAKRALSGNARADFWQPLADRFPMMLDALRRWTRVGSDEAGLVINVALPPVAAQNLFLATELALLDFTTSPTRPEAATVGTGEALEAGGLLERSISLVVRQQSLEAVMQEVAAAVRDKHGVSQFEIELRGQDLQLDGITRNQQLRGIRLEDRPLREVLTEVVRRANPQIVESVQMAEQKLVWVIAPPGAAATKSKVIITTRDSAQKNGWKLPAEFLGKVP